MYLRNLNYLSRSQRQICYNLVIKNFQIQNLGILPGLLASKRKKTHRFDWMIFLPYYKYGRIIVK